MGRKKNELVDKVVETAKRGRGRPKGSKNKPKTPKKLTYIAFVVDRSGSMSSVRQAALDGINEQINTIKKNAELGGETFVTYIQFDQEIETIFANRPAGELEPINEDQYVPRGTTALYDATMEAINRLKYAPTITEDTGFLVIVISDGYENASKTNQYTLSQEVKRLQDSGKWTFTYMLSNVDKSLALNLGVYAGNVAVYDSSVGGTKHAFATINNATQNYASLRNLGLTSSTGFYSPTDAPDISISPLNPTMTTPTDKKDSK